VATSERLENSVIGKILIDKQILSNSRELIVSHHCPTVNPWSKRFLVFVTTIETQNIQAIGSQARLRNPNFRMFNVFKLISGKTTDQRCQTNGWTSFLQLPF